MSEKANKANQASLKSASLSERKKVLTSKDKWKLEPGNRYTADELKEMAQAVEVKIFPRKRLVMRY
jgi:hypothetical protein